MNRVLARLVQPNDIVSLCSGASLACRRRASSITLLYSILLNKQQVRPRSPKDNTDVIFSKKGINIVIIMKRK